MLQKKTANHVSKTSVDVHRMEAYFAGVGFSPHRHDTYTLGVTLQGVQSFDYRGQTRHSLPGEIVVLHPDEVHDGRAGTDAGFRYRSIYIEPSHIQSALGGRPLPYLKGGVSRNRRLFEIVKPLLEELDQSLETLEYQDAIYDLATTLDQLAAPPTPQKHFDYVSAELARLYIHEHLDDGVALETLAAITGCNRWELSRHFRALFGTSPHRYLIMRRLDKARHMLKNGHGLADTAAACAFADQSHFARHFKKAFGQTPHQWCKLH